MPYEKPNLNPSDIREVSRYLFRLVEQLEQHETVLRKDIEEKGINDGKSTARSN